MKVGIRQERCKECSLCVQNCPKQAIKSSDFINFGGYRTTVIDDDLCIACGMCYITCPDGVYEVFGNKK